ncbi:MAG: glutamate-cysteine ligase family protein [Actinomycetota bacterium]|nr:glutamate-cysteine ligase family protein [Actinomycetota bacterium]
MSGDTLTAPLLLSQAEDWLAASTFRAGCPERAGVEIEFFVTDRSDPGRRIPAATLAALASSAPLSAGGTVTGEPGGQVELSTLPHLSLPDILAAAQTDLAELRQRAHAHGLLLVGQGSDPVHAPRRVTEHPRYAAMETYLDRWGPAARQMMCSTAAVQITVEAGQTQADVQRRWDLLHDVGPALVAAFACSPLLAGRRTGWKSTRQRIWGSLDPARTRPVRPELLGGTRPTPQAQYVDYALQAPVLLVRRQEGTWVPGVDLTFRQWIRGDADGRLPRPTLDDLSYHLTTLFPPVRPRGPMEVRYLDAQPGSGWALPLATVWGLVTSPGALDAAREAAAPVVGRWRDAARDGPEDPAIGRAAADCLGIARDALAQAADTAGIAARLDGFIERYPLQGRCPADDVLGGGRYVGDAPADEPGATEERRWA